MNMILSRPAGRIILHLSAYALAAAIVAVIGQMQVMDFGTYQVPVSVLLGALLDAARKYQTSL